MLRLASSRSKLAASIVVAAVGSWGCGARTGLLTCGNGGVFCPNINFAQNKVVCNCTKCELDVGTTTIIGPFAGNVPMCLPTNLNADQSDLSGFDAGSYSKAVANFCSGVVAESIPIIARELLDQCSLGTVSCTCDLNVVNGVAQTGEVPSCVSPCSEVDCNSSNCKNPLLSDGGIDPSKCNCNRAMACGDPDAGVPPLDTGVQCRPGPGDSDPSTLASGAMTQFMSAPSTLDLDPSSSLTATVTFEDTSNNPHSDKETTKLYGHLTTYGVPHSDGSADVLLELGATADNVTYTFSGVGPFNSSVSATIQNIRVFGGAGNLPIHLDASGSGTIIKNSFAFTVNFEQQGNTISVDGGTTNDNETFIASFVNKDDIFVQIDWVKKTFSIPAFPFSDAQNGISGTMQLAGTISNQPPSIKVAAPATVECTSPTGASIALDASGTTDPDNNIVGIAWTAGLGFDPSTVFSHDYTTSTTQSLGTSIYSFFATDSHLAMTFANTSVTVQDTTAPTLTASVAPTCMWPPNGSFVLFELGTTIPYSVKDTCDPNPTVQIVSVTSNETTKTTPNFLFGKKGLCLRSERDGSIKTDRTYTITLSATDASGNTALKDLIVTVPHDQRNDCANVPGSRTVADTDPRCTEN